MKETATTAATAITTATATAITTKICPICKQPILKGQRVIFQYHEKCLKKKVDGQYIIYQLPSGGQIKMKAPRKERRMLKEIKVI